MTGPLGTLRGLLDRWRGAPKDGLESGVRRGSPVHAEGALQPPSAGEEGRGGSSLKQEVAMWRREDMEPVESAEEKREDAMPSRRLARHMMAYLNARAEETLALLLEELSKEMTGELAESLESARKGISAEVAQVREGIQSSHREFSRIGRELVRSGAALESIQAAVAALGPALERMEDSLRAELVQGRNRDRQLYDEVERAALDDMIAALDGLDAGLEEGRELVSALADTQRRLKDAMVQRWWRAMGQATGVKRPLPEIPLEDVEGWIGGLELTYRRLQDALARRGVVPIDAAGKPFDPHLHEAVAVEPCPEEQDGIVLREERRGYRTPERILRLSQVVVGRAVPPQPAGHPVRRKEVPEELPGEEPEDERESGSGQADQQGNNPEDEQTKKEAEGGRCGESRPTI